MPSLVSWNVHTSLPELQPDSYNSRAEYICPAIVFYAPVRAFPGDGPAFVREEDPSINKGGKAIFFDGMNASGLPAVLTTNVIIKTIRKEGVSRVRAGARSLTRAHEHLPDAAEQAASI